MPYGSRPNIPHHPFLANVVAKQLSALPPDAGWMRFFGANNLYKVINPVFRSLQIPAGMLFHRHPSRFPV